MRTVGTIRLALGVLLLGRPAEALGLAQTASNGEALIVTRLLGARYAAQGVFDLAVPHDRRIDAAVEVLHAASMLTVARRGRPHARLALLSAGVATALATADKAVHRRAVLRQLTAGWVANHNQDGDMP